MWCSRPVPLARASAATPRLRYLSIHTPKLRPHFRIVPVASHQTIRSMVSSLPRPCLVPQLQLMRLLPVRSFASHRNRQRSSTNAAPTATTPSSSSSSSTAASTSTTAPPFFSTSAPRPPLPQSSTSPADSGRLIYATTLTLYARGVPYLFLFLLLPVVSYSIYATYTPSTAASAQPTLESYLSILPLTLLPLSFLLLVAAFTRFNRRLISTIHLLPDRTLAITTVNMLPTASSTHPNFILKPLDTLLPPFAWTGSSDRTLQRLRFVRPGEAGGVDEFWLYAVPSKAGQQGVEMLRRIMTDNRISSRDLVM